MLRRRKRENSRENEKNSAFRWIFETKNFPSEKILRFPCLNIPPRTVIVTKIAVNEVVTKDLHQTSGVAFTCDHWTSRNMDAYIGFTLHLISNDWKLNRYNKE